MLSRHPKSNLDLLSDQLEEILRHLNQCKTDLWILGDLNVDFYKFITHNPTEKYLDMLSAYNMIPLTTKPTRLTDHSETLIHHIYTNTPTSHIISGIALYDISDHLPIFCFSNNTIKMNNGKRLFRDYKHFNKEAFLNDLQSIDWNIIRENNENLNDQTANVIKAINEVADAHAPIKQLPRSKQKQFAKPWITDGILKSIKPKQKMYKTHFFSNDLLKIQHYKIYANKLNKLKTTSKIRYYADQFTRCRNNLKATWKLIGTLIKRKTKGSRTHLN